MTGSLAFPSKTDKTRQLPQGRSKMGSESIPTQRDGIPANRFSCFHKTRISGELPSGSQQELDYLSR